MKFSRNIKNVAMGLLCLGLMACNKGSEKSVKGTQKATTTASNRQAVILPETLPLNPEKIKAPAGWAVKKAIPQHTALVGTAEQPTFDGGMINAADGIPVTPAEPEEKTQPAIKPVVAAHTVPLNDKWATEPHITSILNRAIQEGKLAPIVKQTLKLGLPAGTALLPMVESGYQTRAISPKGAGGIWQLMPALAHDYGLNEQQRFDVKASTTVALHHLKSLYQQFGNWELTYAAYNAGAARINRALANNPNASTIDELDIPLETKQYVHRMQQVHTTLVNQAKE